MQYSTADYQYMKQTTAHTWPEMILPGCSRACLFCGQICTRGKKEINHGLVAEMLSGQHAIATAIMTAPMQNSLKNPIQATEE